MPYNCLRMEAPAVVLYENTLTVSEYFVLHTLLRPEFKDHYSLITTDYRTHFPALIMSGQLWTPYQKVAYAMPTTKTPKEISVLSLSSFISCPVSTIKNMTGSVNPKHVAVYVGHSAGAW